jgi:hypothetical protein
MGNKTSSTGLVLVQFIANRYQSNTPPVPGLCFNARYTVKNEDGPDKPELLIPEVKQ